MKNKIETIYYTAVKGISENLLKDKPAWFEYVLKLPLSQQVVYTIVLFHSQVENGGLHQYFFNSYGQFAFLTLKNLKLIGANNRFQLLEKALYKVNGAAVSEEIFRKSIYNRELEKISEFDEELMDYLNLLDKEYYQIQSEEINELLEKFIDSKS